VRLTAYHRTGVSVLVIIFGLGPLSLRTVAYSVLTHEQIIDIAWKDRIQPLLLRRFPQASEEDLRKAHAFAYGGCMMQDMGYYPFGNKYFSDLVHYVRTGDFVINLLKESSDLDEYAFALGALAHYASDNLGHPTINAVTAMEFPKLHRKFGQSVTYEDDPKAHIRTEFGFDMVQVAKNRYTSDRYHDFIGFEVAKPVLARAFQDTYGISIDDVFGDFDLAVGTFRRGVAKVIPEMTKVALVARHDVIVRDTPNFDKKKFLFYLSRADYQKSWGTKYRRPGIGARILAFFLKLIPKFGPFNALAFKIPSTKAEDLYIKSVDLTVEDYSGLLQQVGTGTLRLANLDFDTGRPTQPGEYKLTDKTYARWLDDLAKNDFKQVTPDLQANILQFFSDLNAPIAIKRDKKKWKQLMDEVDQLRNVRVAARQ
jgi:ribosomal protein S9